MKKRILAILCVILMAAALLPVSAFADGTAPVLTTITLSTTAASAPSDITVTVTATDAENDLDAGKIVFACGTEELSAKLTLDEGTELKGKLELEASTPAGTYVIKSLELSDAAGNKAEYGTDTLPDEYKALSISVLKKDTKIVLTLSETTIIKGASTTASIELKDVNGTSILGKDIEILVNNSHFKDVNSGISGSATLTIDGSDVGEYKIQAKFAGDETYTNSESEPTNLKVTAPSPTITDVTVSPTSVALNGNVTVTVTAENAVSGTATFTISGGSNVSIPLALNGSVLTGTLIPAVTGTYNLQKLSLKNASNDEKNFLAGDIQTVAPGKTFSVTVTSGTSGTGGAKENTALTLALGATSMGYGGTTTATVTLKDVNGNALSGKTVYLYEGALKITTLTTGTDGTAAYSYTKATPGTYSLKATFEGDTGYNSITSNAVDITVTSVPATGDSYNLTLWLTVAAAAVGVNALFIIKRRRQEW